MNNSPHDPLVRRTFLQKITAPFRHPLVMAAISVAALHSSAQAYTHPCLPLTASDIATLNANKSTGQWAAGYATFANDGRAKLTYLKSGPYVQVGRNPDVNLTGWRKDMVAIWALALQWKFTGDPAYADLARSILLAYATTHTVWSGVEPYLEQGDYMKFYGEGASILRSYSGWTTADTSTVKNYMANVTYPSATADIPLRSANQGGAHLEGAMGVAIYNDDTELFNRVVNAYRTNSCTGLRNTQSNGQIGDSGRDPGHWRVELLHYAWISEVALKAAGLDLFAENNNRLLAAGEYFADYNGGGNPVFIKSGTCYFDIYIQNCAQAPGARAATIGPDFLHILHGAYVVRKGLSMPILTPYRANQTDDMFTWVFRKAADSSGTGTPLAPVTTPPTPTATLSDLIRQDIGTGFPASSVSFSGGTWSVTSFGIDQWGPIGANEKFTYLYKPVTGNAAMIAKVTSVGDASYPVAGVMFRDSLALGAKLAMSECFKGTGGTSPGNDGLGMSTRGTIGDDHYSNTRFHPSGGVPYWIKVERLGNQVTCFSSADGTNWSPSHTAWYSGLPSTCYLGLCVASRTSGVSTTATFTNVSVTGAGNGNSSAPVITSPITAGGSVGTAFSYTVTATNSPTSRNATGLPAGLSFNPGTGIISGTPTAVGAWPVAISATNASGTGTETLTLSTGGAGFPAPGIYSLLNRGNGLMLDSFGRSANLANCYMYADNPDINQNWILSYVSSNVVKLQGVRGKLFLDGMARGNGSICGQYSDSLSNNQRWTIIDVGGGYFKLKNVSKGVCVDVGASPWANEDPMEQWGDNPSFNQQWQFVAP